VTKTAVEAGQNTNDQRDRNPLIGPVPKIIRKIAEIIPRYMRINNGIKAFYNQYPMIAESFFPVRSSSLIRSKMSTLHQPPYRTVSSRRTIPGNVSGGFKAASMPKTKTMLIMRANLR